MTDAETKRKSCIDHRRAGTEISLASIVLVGTGNVGIHVLCISGSNKIHCCQIVFDFSRILTFAFAVAVCDAFN